MTDAAILALWQQIADDIHAIRTATERRSKGPLTNIQLDYLGRLYPAICGARGSEPFLVRDLADEHAQLRPLLAGRSAKKLGRLLGDTEGVVVDGYVVRRAGHDISTQLWEVLMLPASISRD